MTGLIQVGLTVAWLCTIVWAVYRMLKFRAVIIYPDGTFKEKILSSRTKKFEDGDDLYIVNPACVQRKLIFGVLPQAKIFYLSGSPNPIGFHSGKPVSAPSDLKLLVGSDELRMLYRETRTRRLGQPERIRFELKWLIYAGVLIGIFVVGYMIINAILAPAPAAPMEV